LGAAGAEDVFAMGEACGGAMMKAMVETTGRLRSGVTKTDEQCG